MPARYSLNFKILHNRYPILKAGSTSKAARLMNVIKAELQDVVSTANDVYDARFIQTATGDGLDKHGVTQALPRYAGEHDDDYRDRLLTDFRNIPEGISVASIKYAVDQVMGGSCEVHKYYEDKWMWPSPSAQPDYQELGYNSIGASSSIVALGQVVACKYYLASDENVSIRKVAAYLKAEGDGKRTAHCAIYQDNSGAPTDKVADAEHTVTFDSAGWCEFEFFDVELSQNNDYWLAIGVGDGHWHYYYDAGDTNQVARTSDPPPLNDPFLTPAYDNRKMSIYALHHTYEWKRILCSKSDRFKIAIILPSAPSSSQLDQIQANLTEVKRTDIVARIVEVRPSFYDLHREIL